MPIRLFVADNGAYCVEQGDCYSELAHLPSAAQQVYRISLSRLRLIFHLALHRFLWDRQHLWRGRRVLQLAIDRPARRCRGYVLPSKCVAIFRLLGVDV